jgi:diaminopimelate epimerase
MKEIKFVKMTGAGNDFIIIDRELSFITPSQEQIKLMCDRRYGIGADGVIVISNSLDGKGAFKVDFYNSDGSTGMLCGNGARCSLKYANLIGRIGKNEVEFLFSDRLYRGKVENNGLVKFYIDEDIFFEKVSDINLNGHLLNGYYVDLGTQHLVLNIDNFFGQYQTIDELPVYEIGRKLRYHDKFMPKGVNVNFISIDNEEDVIYIRTYERGVEDETLACGTGSISSAIVASITNKLNPPIKLITRSMEELVVDFQIINDKIIKHISLLGPAKAVFTGKIKV